MVSCDISKLLLDRSQEKRTLHNNIWRATKSNLTLMRIPIKNLSIHAPSYYHKLRSEKQFGKRRNHKIALRYVLCRQALVLTQSRIA